MTTIYDVDPNQLIEKAAVELKKLGLKKPIWTDFVKTGRHKERPPVNNEWWYIRLAAVLRSVYRFGPIGTSKLRTKYGGRKNRGHKPDKVFKGSGSIIRKALQQLEELGFISKTEKGVHKGRMITSKGKSFLDKIAVGIYKPTGKVNAGIMKEVIKVKEKKKGEKKEKPEQKIAEDLEIQIIKEQKGQLDHPEKNIVKKDKEPIIEKIPQELVKQDKKDIIKKQDNLPEQKQRKELVQHKKEIIEKKGEK